ncbi:hypothetical protein GCM10010174_03850 [Kutzneria viridogrisea]|uniref:Uncharacterized protein n=1 Tax=Kutzneria viridogrisea TaxID=47990 RepID=A0ABR6BRH7_9PSEU|nr:hypothetical protein [Kutzneria viridogrisea]
MVRPFQGDRTTAGKRCRAVRDTGAGQNQLVINDPTTDAAATVAFQ